MTDNKYNNTASHTTRALASMPPPPRSGTVADDNSNDGSEPVYTPPGSIEYKSPLSNKRTLEMAPSRNTMARAVSAFEITDQFHNLSIRPEQVSQHAAAIEKDLKECEVALRSIPSSLPNANSYRADLRDRLASLRSRYERAKAGYSVPPERSDYTVRSPGIDLQEPLFPSETNASHGAATSSVHPPVVESEDGRLAMTFTSPPAQTELRMLEELRKVNFYTLTKEEKARVLLPLLTKTYSETGDFLRPGVSQHHEEVAPLEDQVGSRQATGYRAKEPMSQDYARRKSSPKAFTDVLHEISKGSFGRMTDPSHAIPRLSPSTQYRSSQEASARIEKALQAASPKLRAFDQKMGDIQKDRDQPKIKGDARDEQARDNALHRPYVTNDEMVTARIVRQFKLAKQIQPTLHGPNTSDRPCVIDDPELSETLSKVSFREDVSRNGQVPDQDKPDWFESLVQDEDGEVYVGDPSSSPWQSRKQSGSDIHWGSQGRFTRGEPSILGGSPRPAAAPFSKAFKPSEDEMFEFMDAETEAGRGIPAPLLKTFLEQSATVLAQDRTPLLTQALHRLDSGVAKDLAPKPITVQPLDQVHKMPTEALEQGSTPDQLKSARLAARLARHLEFNTARQPEPFVPFSSIDHSFRDSTKSGEGRSEHASDGFTEKLQRHPRWVGFDINPNIRSGSTAEYASSVTALEMTNLDHSDGNEAGSAEASSRCDSCGSPDVDLDNHGVYCGACGIYTEQPMMSRERIRNDYHDKTDTSGWGAPLASGDSNCSWGPTTHESDELTAPSAGGWSVRDSVTNDCGGWSERAAGKVGDDWGAPSLVDASETAGQDNAWSPHVWTKQQDEDLLDQKACSPMRSWARIADDIGLPTYMIKDPAYVCEVRFELLKSEKRERKLTNKEKKWLRKEKIRSEEKKHLKAAVSDAFAATSKQNTSSMPDVKDDSGPYGVSGNDDNTGRAGGVCCDANGNSNENLDAVEVETEHTGVWDSETSVRKSSVGGWGWCEGPQSRQCSPAPSGRAFSTKSKPADPAPKNYTVTYWATVECDDQTIHIPIDDNNISGPEKAILNGPAKKVWKWVQEKGLSNKVGLQDAFDLAKDLHGDDEEDACVACPPRSAPAPSLCEFRSPATAKRFVPPDYESAEVGRLCWGCGEEASWCSCEA
jgi:hypothetical protein